MKNRKLIGVIVIGLIMSSCGFKSDFSKRKYLNLKSKNYSEIVVKESTNSDVEENLTNSIVQISDKAPKTDSLSVDQDMDVKVSEEVVAVENKFYQVSPEKNTGLNSIKTRSDSERTESNNSSMSGVQKMSSESNTDPDTWATVGSIILTIAIVAAAGFVIVIVIAGIWLIWFLLFSWW